MVEWIAIGFTMFIALAQLVKSLGYDKRRMEQFDAHIESCEEVPKKLIVEKLDNLCSRVDEFKGDLDQTRKELKADMLQTKVDVTKYIEAVDKSYHEFRELVLPELLKKGAKP